MRALPRNPSLAETPRAWLSGLVYRVPKGQACAVVIPVHDINPLRRTPWVTYALVAANVIVLFLMPGSPTSVTGTSGQAQVCSEAAFLDRYAAIPRELTTNHQLALVATGKPGPGPDTCYVSRPTYHKEPTLSVFYSMFLHAGWLHLLGNMLFLIVFGNNIEDRFRKIPYLLFYVFCGYVAAYGFALANQTSVQPLIGASGAIAGVLGAYLVIYPRARVWSLVPFLFFIPVRIPAWLVLGLWFVLQWAYSAGYLASGAGSVAYLAHVFGFLAGVVVGLLVRAGSPPPQYPVHPRNR
jgi:membrane associated rhomboid family serine protease